MHFNIFTKKNVEEPNVKLFTHDDTDGCICSVLVQNTFSKVDVDYCSNNNVNDTITSFIINKKYQKFDIILIADVALDKGTSNLINKLIEITEGTLKIEYIDHHKTNLWLNEYSWARVIDREGDVPTCAAQLMYKHLALHYTLKQSPWLDELVEKTRRYDTWEWKTKYNDIESKRLNTLCFASSPLIFVNNILEKSKNRASLFSEKDLVTIEHEESKYQLYLKEKSEDILLQKISKDDVEYKVGVVYAEQYISELGNDIAERYDNLDFILIINSNKKISFRAKNNKPVDLSEIASMYGGGGHPKASGASIDLEIREQNLTALLDSLSKKYTEEV